MMPRLPAVSILCAVIACGKAPAGAGHHANQRESYMRCLTAIKQAPKDSYEPCKAYLERYPSDDENRLRYVKNWVTAHEKMHAYIQFLQGLAPEDQEVSWFVYEPDLQIELPQTSEKEGPYKVNISRSFENGNEEFMLKKAEAVYSSPNTMVEEVFRNLAHLAQDPPKEMAPIWGMRGNDNIQVASIVTTRAVRYYYDLAMTAKQNPHLPTGFDAVDIDLKYDATIKHFDQYSHSKDTFTNVYVADLTLKWGFICGGLCGMGV